MTTATTLKNSKNACTAKMIFMINFAISDKNYEHVINIWKAFILNTIKYYNNLYLQVDVLLLTCVFGNFRKESINSFELDPAYYLSTPGYCWDAMLRFTNVNSKIISDTKKYQFVESMTRGGISMICNGYAEANNKLLKSYHSNKRTLYIIYSDTNNLYGHSMMQLLPAEILDWVNLKDFNLNYCSNGNPISSSLDVDLDYPDELHNLHNDCPLVSEKIKVTEEMLSITNHRK